KNSSCKDSLSFVDPQFTHGDKAIFNIDPARVYAIHYLLASPGGGFGSSWGHSMIRIVMCAPSRTQVGPECLKDVAFHFVLSFRAFAGTPEISNWDGLTGAYNSRLFFLPFAQIINEYNVEQLRDLRSYPLTLSREEIKAFLERAIEVHWSYENKYYFLSNNCAVETMNLFKTGLQRRSLMNARIQTPMSVLSVLQKNNLISNEINFSNLSQAKAQGYYFASYEEGLKFALDVIASYSQQKYSLLQWLNMTPLERRQLFTSKQPAKDQKRWAASFLYLERFLDKKITQIAYNTYMTTTADPTTEIGKQTQKYIESITKNISGMEELTSPASIAKIGYGIPAQGELDEVQKYLEQIQNQRMKNQANIDNLFQQLLQLNKVDADEIKLTRENINIFTQALAH
ncbi:MAG TPA: DUF4105 domain-containing protein, partial [Bdellovibrio sp.]|nr:DUF4105 domain-containing protein [Bdellovibrio sp.]